MKNEKLAIFGGKPIVTKKHPHEKWPPKAEAKELREISAQRNNDIGIKGKTGPIKELEELYKKFLNNKVKYVITFNSGTSALLAAYFALGINEDDEIIGPALTYHAALSPAYFLKANIVLADIDVKTRCINPNEIEPLITKKTKVITVVHQWGRPADMDAIMGIAKKYNLKILEDCSHAHGSKYKGRLCGTFGDVAVFSLQANKAIFAGEGGILVTNNEKTHDRATLLGHYRDRSRDEVKDANYQKYWETGFGLKLRMSPFNAIVAKHALKNFNNIKRERHKCLNYFSKRLSEISYIEAPCHDESSIDMGAWYGFKPLYIKEKLGGLSRKKLIEALRKEGMEADAPSGSALSIQPLYCEKKDLMFPDRKNKKANYASNTPNAIKVQNNALSLPTFWDWKHDKLIIDQYINAFLKIENNIETLLEGSDE